MTGFILGGGVTGLSAGIASGLPILEATERPGGICTSYYLRARDAKRLSEPPASDDAYRFENGGGHWIFGADAGVLRFIQNLRPVLKIERRASVFFPDCSLFVPFPLQANIDRLGPGLKSRMKRETTFIGEIRTMREWLEASFGEALCEKFFFPFHEQYTVGLYRRVAPQDPFKSPRDALNKGYNAEFLYPEGGLGSLVNAMSRLCDIRYCKQVVGIDLKGREIQIADGTILPYRLLLSTLPLNRMIELCGISLENVPDPWTSVLVLNIAAVRGERCPDDHWIYLPTTRSGFHRIGLYSNVDQSFLPKAERGRKRVVSLYVERAFVGTGPPADSMVEEYSASVLVELREWGFIEDLLIMDPTWIDVAYTWSWPGSRWSEEAIKTLEGAGVFMVGRYARWRFQGIAESIRDGIVLGTAARVAASF